MLNMRNSEPLPVAAIGLRQTETKGGLPVAFEELHNPVGLEVWVVLLCSLCCTSKL